MIKRFSVLFVFIAIGFCVPAFAAEQVDLKKATEQKKEVETTLQALLKAQERGDRVNRTPSRGEGLSKEF